MTSNLSLIDAHKVFLIDISLGGEQQELYHHDIHISTSDHSMDVHYLLQSALEFILHTPQSVMQISKAKDEFGNDCVRVLLENWEKGSKLFCTIFNVKDYPASTKEDFVKYLSVQDIVPQEHALEHFREFLGDDDMDDDNSTIELVTVEKGSERSIYKLRNRMNLTSLCQKLIDIAFSKEGSLVFKVNTYPYFELQYPDRTTTGVWLNLDTTAGSDSTHELEGI